MGFSNAASDQGSAGRYLSSYSALSISPCQLFGADCESPAVRAKSNHLAIVDVLGIGNT